MSFHPIIALVVAGTGLSVPSQFQGEWRISKAECPPEVTDRPVWINASKIRIDHAIGDIRVVAKKGRHRLTVAGELLSDGDPWNAKLQLQLSPLGNELKISEGSWAMKLHRCSEKKPNK